MFEVTGLTCINWQEEAQKHAEKKQKEQEKEMAASEKQLKRKARDDDKENKKQEAAAKKQEAAAKKQEAAAKKQEAAAKKQEAAAKQLEAATKKLEAAQKGEAAATKPQKKQKTGDESQDAMVVTASSSARGKPLVTEEDRRAAAERDLLRPFQGTSGISADPRKKLADENFTVLMEVGIPELEVRLGDKKSYTMLPPTSPFKDGACSVGVILTSCSFYVNRVMLPENEWSDDMKKLYKVGFCELMFSSCSTCNHMVHKMFYFSCT